MPVHSPLYFVEIANAHATKVNIGEYLYGESALYILKGSITCEGETYGTKQILIAKNSKLCTFEMAENSVVYIFGGEPFPEERYIDWNFVSSNKSLIEKAKKDWNEQKFPKVPEETEFVPYPKRK